MPKPVITAGLKGRPLSEELRTKLVDLINRVGEAEARQVVGLSPATFARCVAALPVYPGSRAQVQLALEVRRP